MFGMKRNPVNDYKRKMIAISFLVLFMGGMICMSGISQNEINDLNNSDRVIEYEDVDQDIDLIEIVEINKPVKLYLAMKY